MERMATKLDDISEAIGSLRAEVRILTANTADNMRRADEHRAVIHKRVDDMVGEFSDVKADLAAVQKDVAEMKPVTDDVKRWRLMGMGALGLIGIGGTAFGVLLAKPIEALAAFMRGG
jgi:hypothetical protein